jgi:hypothetical protein
VAPGAFAQQEPGTATGRRLPVDPNDALSGLDHASISLVVCATRHANGQRTDHIVSGEYDVRHIKGQKSPHDKPSSTQNSRTRIGQAESQHRCPAHGECGKKPEPGLAYRAPAQRPGRPGHPVRAHADRLRLGSARKLLKNEDAMIYDNPHALVLCHYKRDKTLCHRDGIKDTPSLDHCVAGWGNIARTDQQAARLRERALALKTQ